MTEILKYDEARDFDSIIELCRAEGWTKFFGEKRESFKKALKVSESYSAFVDSEYAGFIRCITDGCFTIYCCEMIVAEKFRRRRIGISLMEKVRSEYPELCTDVISDNDDFYTADGFIILGNGMRKR